ncbi:MAG: methyltransferase domain-containing protein [Terracidiphilus sp.]
MKILNLGCGLKTSSSPDVLNVDWNIYLRFKRNPLLRAFARWVFRGERLRYFRGLPDNILVHDLSKGIPFPNDSIDVVYHSHILEHLDRDVAPRFLLEIRRVLKQDGLLRIVVPDLEEAARLYLAHVAACERDATEAARHDTVIGAMIEQMVRRESGHTRLQRPLQRFLENKVLGDARRRGETHQWMYDRFNLSALLTQLGYRNPEIHQFNTSRIAHWNEYGLDQNAAGGEYHLAKSLYMEAQK